MSRVRVASFAVSADGYGAGPNQGRNAPLGEGGPKLHEWFYPTHTFQSKLAGKSGVKNVDDDFARRGFEGVGAWILGRNMYSPNRGGNDTWKGWWGDEPPYHVPVFVLTHHARESFALGETQFHFATGGLEDTLRRAREAAGGKDVRIGGGASTIRQYLEARLIDDMHVVVSPVVLGSGEPFWQGLDLPKLGYELREHETTDAALHLVFAKKA